MNSIKLFLFPLIILLVLPLVCSCAGRAALSSAGGEIPGDISGIYHGIIPAADCPGIVVVMILNEEGLYRMTYQYLDRDVPLLTFTGSYRVDSGSSRIILDDTELPSYRITGKDSLRQLDMSGNEISGKLAASYELRKSLVKE